MVNINGTVHSTHTQKCLSVGNRGFKYGDAVFETMVVFRQQQVNFIEDHYFRLMRAMRIMRMDIPSEFTLNFFEKEIKKTIHQSEFLDSPSRIRMTIFRSGGGYYTPISHDINYIIECNPLEADKYNLLSSPYEVDIFKDHFISPSLLSTIKSNNKAIHVLGSIYAKENRLNNCLLLNTNKKIIEALQSNVFVVYGKTIKTPPLESGCQYGIIRKQIIKSFSDENDYIVKEEQISPFELQNADEIFLTNVVMGIQPVTKFKKKMFPINISQRLTTFLNYLVEK